jgi:hypothetical protein
MQPEGPTQATRGSGADAQVGSEVEEAIRSTPADGRPRVPNKGAQCRSGVLAPRNSSILLRLIDQSPIVVVVRYDQSIAGDGDSAHVQAQARRT